MKLTLRRKIIFTNLIVLMLTFLVVSVIVIEGLNSLNLRMLINNLIHQADVSVISIKQSLLSSQDTYAIEEEFMLRSSDFALKLSREAGVRVAVFSTSKELIADSDGIRPLKAHFKELDHVLEGNRAYVIRRTGASRYLHFTFPVILSDVIIGQVMFVYPLRELDSIRRNIHILLLISFGVGIMVILSVSIVLSHKITRPILQLKQSASQIANGSFINKINIQSTDEVGELACAFNSMSAEIENRISIINVEKGKLNSILESMGEGVIALNANDEVISINNKARILLEFLDQLELRRITDRVRESNSRVVSEVNSDEKSLLICATPLILDESPRGIVLILNDITELRLLQEKQKQFVTNVSHELKTPLTTIMGYIELLSTKGDNREVFDMSLGYLQDASERLSRLVTDLIDLSCLSKFEFEVEPKSINVSSLLRDITGQMALKAQKFNTTITVDAPESLEILADPARLKQAIVNVLDNAIKYSPGGKISVALQTHRDHIQLDIQDNGCGIPEEIMGKVFEPFYRVDKARSRVLGGNGLGLPITKEIIEKHNGRITIKSKDGKGTCVTILLPAS